MTNTLTRPTAKEATPDINFCNACKETNADMTHYEISCGSVGVFLCQDCYNDLFVDMAKGVTA